MKSITKEQIEALIDKYLILQNVKKGNWNTDQLLLCHPDDGCTGRELIAEGTSLVYKKEWFKTILFSLIEEAIQIHSNIDQFQLQKLEANEIMTDFEQFVKQDSENEKLFRKSLNINKKEL